MEQNELCNWLWNFRWVTKWGDELGFIWLHQSVGKAAFIGLDWRTGPLRHSWGLRYETPVLLYGTIEPQEQKQPWTPTRYILMSCTLIFSFFLLWPHDIMAVKALVIWVALMWTEFFIFVDWLLMFILKYCTKLLRFRFVNLWYKNATISYFFPHTLWMSSWNQVSLFY